MALMVTKGVYVARTRKNSTDTFREKLGNEPIEVGDYKVDELRKIASEFGVSGSHDLKKEDLVVAINRARENESKR
jgi:hypothetical protein